ncbi:MAG: hypothetical protein ABH848_02595 [Candidatus Omnitrophota bacterium]
MNKNRRRKFFANKLHREIFSLVFLASIVPAGIITIAMYYLVFNVTSNQIMIPEMIAYHIIPAARKVTKFLIVSMPIATIIMLFVAYKVSHNIIGPFDRISDDLDKRLSEGKYEHIKIRNSDKFSPIVHKINRLLDKIK